MEATCKCKDKAYVSWAYMYRNVCAHENEFEMAGGGAPLVAKSTPYGRPVRV